MHHPVSREKLRIPPPLAQRPNRPQSGHGSTDYDDRVMPPADRRDDDERRIYHCSLLQNGCLVTRKIHRRIHAGSQQNGRLKRQKGVRLSMNRPDESRRM